MSVVTHNLLATNAANKLQINNRSWNKSAEKLSSGYKVNRAADDAAGLSISEKMRNQIRNLNQATDNVEDGISYIQTADGALSNMHSILHRMEELAVQSANDTYTDEDRALIDLEVQELKEEIEKVCVDTSFNGRKIWDINATSFTLIGYETVQSTTVNQSYDSITITNANKDAVSQNGYKINVKGTDPTKPDEYGFTIDWKGVGGTDYSSKLVSWDKIDIDGGTSNIRLADYLDTSKPELAGINFNISMDVEEGSTVEDVAASVNGLVYGSSIYSSEIVSNLNGNLNGVSISFDSNYLFDYATGRDFDNYDTAWIEPSGTANVTHPDYSKPLDDTGWSFKFNAKNIGTITATSSGLTIYAHDKHSDDYKSWWETIKQPGYQYDINLGYSSNYGGTLHGLTDAIKNYDNRSLPNGKPVSITAGAENGGYVTIGFNLTLDSGSYSYGGQTTNAIGSMSMSIPIYDTDTSESLINRVKATLNSTARLDISSNAQTAYQQTYPPIANTREIQVPIYDYANGLMIQSGANAGEDFEIKYKTLRLSSLGIKKTTLKTRDDAVAALDSIQAAVKIVSGERSLFGAYQNRMEYTVNNNNNYSENLTMAESSIRDTDMAAELTDYSKHHILLQSAQSMLTQASKANEGVLSLLQ